MTEVVVTRAGQITLTKDVREKLNIREGDIVVINTTGSTVTISKRNPAVFDKVRPFLPEHFETILKKIRTAPTARLKRLGILP